MSPGGQREAAASVAGRLSPDERRLPLKHGSRHRRAPAVVHADDDDVTTTSPIT